MNKRTEHLLNLRGNSIGEINDQSSHGQIFQNQTLRPILKLQNDLLILIFRHYFENHHRDFKSLTIDNKIAAIESAVQKDLKFRNILKGIVIGFFSEEEYLTYLDDSSSLNKRILGMITERVTSQLQLLE